MSAVQLFTDNFTRANGPPGNGWNDVHGGIWAIASNQLVATADGTGAPQNGAFGLLRPAAEDRLDQQVVITFVLNTAGVNHWAMLRYDRASTDRYLVVATGGALAIQKVIGGSGAGLNAAGHSVPDGHTARLTVTASGTSPTTITATLFDVTAGTTAATVTSTDSSATLQGVKASGLAYDAGTAGATTSYLSFTNSDLDAATGYTLTPASNTVSTGGVAAFSLTPVGGSLAGTITPHVTGSAVASPATVVFTGQNSPLTFAVTDAAAETVTVSATNSASLANPGNATLTVTARRRRRGGCFIRGLGPDGRRRPPLLPGGWRLTGRKG
jgi:hypothetical protein